MILISEFLKCVISVSLNFYSHLQWWFHPATPRRFWVVRDAWEINVINLSPWMFLWKLFPKKWLETSSNFPQEFKVFLLRSLSPCSVILAEPKTVCAASRKATSRGKPFFTWDSPVFYSPIELWLNREMDLQPLHTLQSCFWSIKSWPQTAATLENVISAGAPNSAIRHWFDHHVPWHC